jgi:hypothetical protein
VPLVNRIQALPLAQPCPLSYALNKPEKLLDTPTSPTATPDWSDIVYTGACNCCCNSPT